MHPATPLNLYIVACQAHPVLVFCLGHLKLIVCFESPRSYIFGISWFVWSVSLGCLYRRPHFHGTREYISQVVSHSNFNYSPLLVCVWFCRLLVMRNRKLQIAFIGNLPNEQQSCESFILLIQYKA